MNTDQKYITRAQLSARWQCSKETLKRLEKKNVLIAHKFGQRFVRYSLEHIIELEESAKTSL